MKYYNENTFTGKDGRVWWNPSLLSRSGSVDCTAEPMDMTAIVPGGGSGSIDCAFDEMVCHFHPYEAPPVSGDVVCSFDIPVFSAEPGRQMACTAQPWEFESGIYVPGYGGVMDNCTFREFRAEWGGAFTLVSLDLDFRRPVCDMGIGLGLDLNLENLDLLMSASVGSVANIEAEMAEPTMEAVGGGPPEMDCSFELLTGEISGNTEILLGLNLDMKKPVAELVGNSDIVSSLDLRFQAPYSGGWEGQIDSIPGDLSIQLLKIHAKFEGIVGPVGVIESYFNKSKLEMTAIPGGPNSMDVVATEPRIDLSVITECSASETLKYEAA